MPQTKTAAPVLQHRDGKTKNFITCILPYISPICKAFANFTLTACGLGALCAVVALAQGGGAAALAGLACWMNWPEITATVILSGLASGLASTGLHQAFKQILEGFGNGK